MLTSSNSKTFFDFLFYSEWLQVLDKEYLAPPDALTWQDAWNFCKNKGGKLAEPKSLQDATDVQDIAMVYGDCCMGGSIWLGILGNSGIFQYASDWSPIVFSNWDPCEWRTFSK